MSSKNHHHQDTPIPTGTILLDRYEVLRPLGAGASGVVYAVKDNILCGWTVALKLFPSRLLSEHEGSTRLNREVTTLSGIQHPNVSKFYDFVFLEEHVGFTMEYIDGGTLGHKIESGFPLSIKEIVPILVQVCSGLKAIAAVGVVHRDIKPDNILITRDGIAKIADFGVVRLDEMIRHVEESDGISVVEFNRNGLTQEGDVVGTLDYLSPEYLNEGFVDSRTDIYAFGVLAYELITSKVPFEELSVLQLLKAKIERDPPAPEEVRPDCPTELSDIVMKALTRDPDYRYQNAEDLYQALWQFQRELATQRPKPRVQEKPKPRVNPFSPLARSLSRGFVWISDQWMIFVFFLFVFVAGAVIFDWMIKNTSFNTDTMRFESIDV